MKPRIVIKVGSNILTQEGGILNRTVITSLVKQLLTVKKQGWDVVLVSSGAVAAGRSLIQSNDKQLLAALGQVKLVQTYAELLAEHSQLCAQVLVTKDDFRDRSHYFNLRSCFETLLHDNIIPVVNENDVIAVSELFFTDNDELAGLVASMIGAEQLLILTNVNGIYNGHPDNPDSSVISEVNRANVAEVTEYIAPVKSSFGRGGMVTKLRMARKLAQQGITTRIANGNHENVITETIAGKQFGTTFTAERKKPNLKRRIANAEGFEKGTVVINDCAVDILTSPDKVASLLPVGITKVIGDFEKGDIVGIISESGERIGFGQVKFGSERTDQLKGQQKASALIHYDYLFIG